MLSIRADITTQAEMAAVGAVISVRRFFGGRGVAPADDVSC